MVCLQPGELPEDSEFKDVAASTLFPDWIEWTFRVSARWQELSAQGFGDQDLYAGTQQVCWILVTDDVVFCDAPGTACVPSTGSSFGSVRSHHPSTCKQLLTAPKELRSAPQQLRVTHLM